MDGKPNQQEIEALLKAANRIRQEAKQSRAVEPWRVERPGQFGAEQASAVNGVHESLAKGLTQSLAVYLRVSFEAAFVSMQQIKFREFLDQIGHGTYCLSAQFCGASAAIQIDNSIVFPLIDILLGGKGQGATADREVTEIEDHVMEGVGKIICHEIATAWACDPESCDLIGAQGLAKMQRLLPANDRVVVSQFESKIGEASGKLQALIPEVTFNSLVRKLSNETGQTKSPRPASTDKLSEKLLECRFPVSLAVTSMQIPLDRLMNLGIDQICDLGVPVRQAATLIIAGRSAFDAVPVRQGRKRAAQIGEEKTHSEQKGTRQQ